MHLDHSDSLECASDAHRNEFTRLQCLFTDTEDVKLEILTAKLNVSTLPLLQPDIDEAWHRGTSRPRSLPKTPVPATTSLPRSPSPTIPSMLSPWATLIKLRTSNKKTRSMTWRTQLESGRFSSPLFPTCTQSCGTSRVWLFWTKAPASQISLKPKVGQSGYVALSRASKLKDDISDDGLLSHCCLLRH